MAGVRAAVVVDRVHDYQVPVIRGAEAAIHAAGAALLVIVSHPQDSRQDMLVQVLVQAGLIDGVVLTGLRDGSTNQSRVARMVGYLDGIPSVTVGLKVPRMPSVLSENAGGTRAAMLHLLDECGRSRPLFMAGARDNSDSDEREAAFLAVAAERELRLPRVPVVHGAFEREFAYRRIVELLADGRDFDAVLAANDDMAMGVLDALTERGVRVPHDVAVVGFDNVPEGHRTKPPLSSVDIELVEQGKAAARHVLAQLAGEAAPHRIRPSATLVVRRSSATSSPTDLSPQALAELSRAAAAPVAPRVLTPVTTETPPGMPAPGSTRRDGSAARVLAALATVVGPLESRFRRRLLRLGIEWVPRISDGTLAFEEGEDLAAGLVDLVAEYPEPLWWRGLTASLQAALAASAPEGQATIGTQMGLMRLSLFVDRALASVREERYEGRLTLSEHLLDLNRALSNCRSLPDLTRELGAYLSRLNIDRCFLVLLDRHIDRRPHRLSDQEDLEVLERTHRQGGFGLGRVKMSYRDGVLDPAPDPQAFSIDQLLPPSLAGELTHGTLTVQPLFTTERWFGLALHEQSVIDRYTGEALRLDVSRVLDTIARAEELTERATELEALVAMRTEQLELEVASRRAAQESLHEANLDLRRALLLDGLTGLQNRPSFDDHLTQTWHQHERGGEPMSLLMVDVDHFKRYNDTCGHLAGDTCLRNVAACLREAVSRKQDIVARYGGEEFAIILPDTGLEGAGKVADRVLRGLREAAIPHPSSDNPSGLVSASIGLACTDVLAVKSPEELLALADQALYLAKRNGRDRAENASEPGSEAASGG